MVVPVKPEPPDIEHRCSACGQERGTCWCRAWSFVLVPLVTVLIGEWVGYALYCLYRQLPGM